MKTKQPKAEKSELEKTIASYERAIARGAQQKKQVVAEADARVLQIREDAEHECARIDKRLAKSRVLLDALKKGALSA